MIIVLAPDDADVVRTSRQQSANFPQIYGATYLYGEQIPMLGPQEDLFFTGHGVINGASGNPEIGHADGDALGLDGLELWENFRNRFPPLYSGDVYINTCHGADFRRGAFSLAEVFRSQIEPTFGDSDVFSRSGRVDIAIPQPFDTSWNEA